MTLCSAPLVAQVPSWVLKVPANSPAPRSSHAMAYDAARGQVVLFGGYNGSIIRNDTWVWDGANWTQKSPANSPPSRYWHAMAYDAARGEVVLFGGYDDNLVHNDTWVWDGANWTQKSPANSPPSIYAPTMAYDVARGQVVLFVGADSSNLLHNDTWVWDGANWTKKSPANNPPSCRACAMAYDAARGQVLLFEGLYGDGNTWVWDGANWTQKSPANSLPARYGFAMAFDTVRGQVVLFGGSNGINLLNDTWVWDGANWSQKNPANSPPSRYWHAMAYDAIREQVVLFGGYDSVGPFRNDTWVWPGDSASTNPLISNISPTSGAPGTAVTISGDRFGSVQGSSVVRLGSLSALVTSWSNTQIRAVVPFVASLNLSYDFSVSTSQGTSNGIAFLVTGSSSGGGVQPPGQTGVQPCPGPAGRRITLVPQSTTGYSVLLMANEVTICSTPDEITSDITLENNWQAWYFVTILPTNVGVGLPSDFLLAPGAKRTFRLTFKRGEQITFFADASFRTPPQDRQDLLLYGAFGAEFVWRLFNGSPLPSNYLDWALFTAKTLDPTDGFVGLGVAVFKLDIPGVLKAIEKIASDPILPTQLTAYGIPITENLSVIKYATRLYRILELLTNEFIAAVSRPNDALSIRAQ